MKFEDIAAFIKYDPKTVYLSGSLYDGFGHALSDVDIYVITDDNSIRDDREVQIEFSDSLTERFDIEYWHVDKVMSLIDHLNEFEEHAFDNDRMPSIEVKSRNFLHRLTIASPIQGEDFFSDLRTKINLPSLSMLNYHINNDNYQGFHEDVVGLMESNDYDSALLALNCAFQLALEAYLSMMGENYISDKWTLRKLKKINRMDMYKGYLDFLKGKDNENMKTFIERNLDLSSQYIQEAQNEAGKKYE